MSLPSSAKAATAGPVDLQQLKAVQGPSAGQVTLWWIPYYASTTAYNVVYGTQSKNYQYSALNVPSIGVGVPQSLTINLLNPGQTYYFALMPIMNGTPTGMTTMEVAMTAMGGTVTTTSSAAPVASVGQVGGSPIYIANGANSNLFSDPHPFNFSAVTGNTSGTVNLSWIDKYNVANKYDIMYGTTPGVYLYGAWGLAETPGINTFTVGLLQPGVTYYFALVSEQGGQTLTISSPRVAVAR